MTATRILVGLWTAFFIASFAAAAETKGNIVKIDPAKKELVIETAGLGVTRGQVLAFTLGPDTKVEIGLIAGQPGTLNSLFAGQRVRVEFEEKGGQRVATQVRVVAALSPSPPAGAPVAPAPALGDDVKGALRHIGITDREIIVAFPGPQGKEAYSVISVPAETKILRDGKPIRFEDLKDEEGVIVQTEKEKKNGRRVARVIQAGETVPLAAATDVKYGVGRIRQLIQLPKQLMAESSDAQQPLPIDPELLRRSQGLLEQLDRILEMVELSQRKK